MGIVSGLLRRGEPERRMSFEQLASLLGGPTSTAGVRVTEEGALQQATVFACVRRIAETVGIMPLILYRRLERGKDRATSHPVYGLLHTLPNPYIIPSKYKETVAGHLALWGDHYSEIEFDGAGRRKALWPLRPDRTVMGFDGNVPFYDYTLPSGEVKRLPWWRIWHVQGFGTDPFKGQSTIALARETIGLALATERYGATFFSNGSRPGGILKHPGKLKDATKLKQSWEGAFGGLSNAQRVAVLEEGVEWQAVGVPPEEAQFLQTRQYQDTQICSIFGVPPHLVGITDRSTSWGTGIEEQTKGFVTFTLQPYLTRIEQSIGRDLLSGPERQEYFAEFLRDSLVQADLTARYQAYAVGLGNGFLCPDDVREKENMNPLPGGVGQVFRGPLNIAPLGSEPEPVEPNGNAAGGGSQNGNGGDASEGGKDDDEATD